MKIGRFFFKLDDLAHISILNIIWRNIVQIWRSFDLYSVKIPRNFAENF